MKCLNLQYLIIATIFVTYSVKFSLVNFVVLLSLIRAQWQWLVSFCFTNSFDIFSSGHGFQAFWY